MIIKSTKKSLAMALVGLKNSNAGIMMAATTLSLFVRGIGFLKEILIAAIFGISAALDNYVLLLLIVTFFVGPVAGSIGTLLTRKLPELSIGGYDENVANLVLKCLAFSVICSCLLGGVAVSWYHLVSIGNGVSLQHPESSGGVSLLMFPIGLLSAATITANAVLSSEKRFLGQNVIPATVPISIIIFCLLAPNGTEFIALIVGTLVGFALEASLTILTIRVLLCCGTPKTIFQKDNLFGAFIKLWGPMFVSGIVLSGCLVVDQMMAFMAGEGAVSTISFSSRISLGLLSLAAVLWLVLYPHFIELALKKDYARLKKTYLMVVSGVLTSGRCLCSVMVFFSTPITATLFERGAFNYKDTMIVAEVQSF